MRQEARSRWFKVLMTCVAAVLFAFAGIMQGRLNQVRETMGLTRIEPLENAPPVLAFTTVALGSFRGLIANALWMRATDMQDEGRYFEMIQLASWITKLQPRITTVWYHQAWNMAYNISIKFQDPSDRWKWVSAGIALLRDEGIQWNPHETLLYRELAWFFQHKMGHNLDDAHMYFKTVWAREMTQAFGAPRPDFDRLLADPADQTVEERERVRVLKEKYKLEPELMKEVDERYGPLEWRLPEAHAIYWAYVGLQRSDPEELITLRRAIYQSMQLAFHRGRIVESPFDDRIAFGPNLDIVGKVSAAYEEHRSMEPDLDEHIGRAQRNFLKDAVYFLYTSGRRVEALKWLNTIREKFPGALPSDQSLDDYAVDRVEEVIGETSHDKVKMAIEGLLTESYVNLALGDTEQADALERLARFAWTRFSKKTEQSRERLPLEPYAFFKKAVVDQMLDPNTSRWSPQLQDQLRTLLGRPAPATPEGGEPTPAEG